MAIPHIFATGPAHIYVGLGTGGAPLYFGTAERSPKQQHRPHWDVVFNDLGGNKVPFDFLYEGEDCFLTAVMTRWDETVYQLMAARPTHNILNDAILGTQRPGDMGTFMVAEGFAYKMWLQYPYYNRPHLQGSGLPAGYRFLNCFMEGPDEFDPLGTSAERKFLIWHAIRGRNFSPGNVSTLDPVTTMNMPLYDFDMSGLPSPT